MGSCKACGSETNEQGLALPAENTECNSCSHCHQPKSSCTCATFCEEDHTIRIIKKQYGFTLRSTNSLVWPAPNQTVTFFTSGVERLSIGTILWHPTAGYLHVTGFDVATQSVIAKNEGDSCNTYTGGESLPACTDFVVGPPSCNTGATPLPNLPYLAADFISPAESECALASVTNIIGLTVNDIVSVNGYEYRIGEIIDTDTIQLCNDGGGASEGTVIPWDDDSDEVPNIPIIVTASENPCTRDSVNAGVILACDGSSVARPLEGSISGQIPVWNEITNRYELESIAAPYTVCVSLTVDLTLDPGHAGSYAITVTDTSDFTAGDVVVIDGKYFEVTVVDSGTVMHVLNQVPVTAIEVVPTGSTVCLDASGNFANAQGDLSDNETGTVVGVASLLETDPASVTITNPSTARNLHYRAIANGHCQVIGVGGTGSLAYTLSLSTDGGAYAPLTDLSDTFPEGSRASMQLNDSFIGTLAPGDSVTLAIKMKVTLTNDSGGLSSFDVEKLKAYITTFEVAV